MDDPSTNGVSEGFGLLFYNARMYDPSIGRFTSADSIVPGGVQGYDRYAYVNNNPVRYTDPTGHMCSDPEDTWSPMCDGADNVGDKSHGGGLGGRGGSPTTLPLGGNSGNNDPDPEDGEGGCLICLPASTAQPIFPIMPVSPTIPFPTDTPQYSVPSTTFEDLVNYWEFSFEAYNFLHLVELAENYLVPAYKQVKYTIPLGSYEYGIDAALQVYDDRNKNLNLPQRGARATIRWGESAITDGASVLAGVGAGVGCGCGVGYFAGAYLTSGIIDKGFTDHFNPWLFGNFLGGP